MFLQTNQCIGYLLNNFSRHTPIGCMIAALKFIKTLTTYYTAITSLFTWYFTLYEIIKITVFNKIEITTK